ncbi:MAG: hypothetical protein RL757_3033 [Bacteroidota bacterium]|jgi:predicted O-methyltransferase YrrM
MKALWRLFWQLVKFYTVAKTRQNVHSPFVFEFTERVLDDKRQFYAFSEIETLRKALRKSDETVEVVDLGAGSHLSGVARRRRVSDIARSAVSPRFQCEVLFRLVEWQKPRNIVELGTSLGVSALYMAAAADTHVHTLEGAAAIAKTAKRNWNWFAEFVQNKDFGKHYPENIQNKNNSQNVDLIEKIELTEGNFDETFPAVLSRIGQLDMAFIDGNHRKEPTLRYFETALKHVHENSILIFDDIHWSADMQSAWSTIQAHPRVRISIDLFWCGIVFFRSENREKEHFKLLPARIKPFSLGLFG